MKKQRLSEALRMAIEKDIEELDKPGKAPVKAQPKLAAEEAPKKIACTVCNGTGLDGEVLCATCKGSGTV